MLKLLGVARIHQVLSQIVELTLRQHTVEIEREQVNEVFSQAAILQHLRNPVQEEAHVDLGVLLQAEGDRGGLRPNRASGSTTTLLRVGLL